MKIFSEIFKVGRCELIELVKRGRVQLAIPQNIVRYDSYFISEVLEANSNSIIFSRRLAASSLIEVRNRTGLFCHSFESDEKYKFLNAISKSDNEILKLLASDLSSRWNYSESAINSQGACGVSFAGISPFVSKLFESRGKDRTMEIHSTAMSFEWALGLGSHYFPYDSQEYSEVNAAKILAATYGGFKANDPALAEAKLENIIDSILTINNDISVLELDDILTSGEIRRLSVLMESFVDLKPEDFKREVYEFNKKIKGLERNRGRLSGMAINGFIPAAATAAGLFSKHPYVGLSTWIICAIGNNIIHSRLSNTKILDSLIALNNRTDRDIVLVNRIRKSLS